MSIRTSKIDRVPEMMGDNAKKVEDILKSVDWPYMARAAAIGYGVFLVVLFTTIAVIRLALKV